jgi:hypothetical protein
MTFTVLAFPVDDRSPAPLLKLLQPCAALRIHAALDTKSVCLLAHREDDEHRISRY